MVEGVSTGFSRSCARRRRLPCRAEGAKDLGCSSDILSGACWGSREHHVRGALSDRDRRVRSEQGEQSARLPRTSASGASRSPTRQGHSLRGRASSAARLARPAKTRREPRTTEIEGIIMNKLQKKKGGLQSSSSCAVKDVGTPGRPRLCVTRSTQRLHCRDRRRLSKTICGVSNARPLISQGSRDPAARPSRAQLPSAASSRRRRNPVSRKSCSTVAATCITGVKALAGAAREGGLKF